MKIRNGFVSNSSSTAFVVIDNSGELYNFRSDDGDILVVGKRGKTEFGWEQEVSKDIYSKINFAYLQAFEYSNNKQWQELLIRTITNYTDIKRVIDNITEEGYIDHQSAATEGENTEIFESEKVLRNFLFGKNSKIVTDNDNH